MCDDAADLSLRDVDWACYLIRFFPHRRATMMTLSRRRWLRIGLAFLVINAGIPGVWAALAPRSFYDNFPLPSHPWVSMLPPYNEHLVRDVGMLGLSLTIVIGAAAVFLDARLVNVALFASAVFFVPHMFWHLNHLESYGVGDIIGQIVVTVLSAVIPLGFLVWNLQPVKPHREVDR